jgi:hypothetical protein
LERSLTPDDFVASKIIDFRGLRYIETAFFFSCLPCDFLAFEFGVTLVSVLKIRVIKDSTKEESRNHKLTVKSIEALLKCLITCI